SSSRCSTCSRSSAARARSPRSASAPTERWTPKPCAPAGVFRWRASAPPWPPAWGRSRPRSAARSRQVRDLPLATDEAPVHRHFGIRTRPLVADDFAHQADARGVARHDDGPILRLVELGALADPVLNDALDGRLLALPGDDEAHDLGDLP